jgi:cystathionine beta-lyase
VKRLRERHGWNIKKDWVVCIQGLVPALTLSCMVVGNKGDEIITTVPVYGPFMKAPEAAEKKLVKVQMKLENHRWTMDFDAIRAAITPRTCMFMLCNPYNPAGTVFTEEELQTLAAICVENNIILCSDEIHCDLILDQSKQHISVATLNKVIENQTITLLSPSKTFNIAGLGCSFAVIPNHEIRAKFTNLKNIAQPMLSAYAYQAALAAYRDSNDWHEQLLVYLRKNHDFVLERINSFEGMCMSPLAATYLAWIDTRQLGIENITYLLESVGVGVSEGGFFFDGKGFIRLNFGTQKQQLVIAFERMSRLFSH